MVQCVCVCVCVREREKERERKPAWRITLAGVGCICGPEDLQYLSEI